MISNRKEQIIVNQWAALLRLLKRDIDDDYRAYEDSETPSMLVTFGLDADGNWSYQTGDNSYTGGAYGYAHWGLVYLDRRSNCKALAQEAFNEAVDQIEETQS